ncbi:hypothetical protein [Occallatibacter savannae]|uniref:hypothetical protein n=1 Tax=Occallatibacter savannae TaxID=1002691 RepID=UPI000D68C2C8|nr:hypothetical protein [Occallatibacter savannae]
MKKIAVAVLMAVVCSAPAFARHKKPHKDPRVIDHPKAVHEKNPHLKEIQKHKMPKHNTAK